MNPSKKSLQVLSVVLILFAVVVFRFLLPKLRNDKTEEVSTAISETTSQDREKDKPIRVSAQSAEIKDLIGRIISTGLTKASREIAICPKVGGQVVNLSLKNGNFVNQGSLLLALDDREYNLTLREAKNRLLGARRNMDFRKGILKQIRI